MSSALEESTGGGDSDRDPVDRLTDGASVRWGALASTIVATFGYVGIAAVIDFIQSVPGGVVRAIGDVGDWLADDIVARLLEALAQSFEISYWSLRASGLLETFGPFAAPAAIVIGLSLTWAILFTIDKATDLAIGGQ